jgi:hypothetical protein
MEIEVTEWREISSSRLIKAKVGSPSSSGNDTEN